MKNEYCIYLRKSRADLELEKIEKMETLARHEHALLELARKRELKIGKIYRELVSGESIDSRPQMQELLDDIYLGKWKGVLVMEVERLARGNTREQGVVAEAIMDTNTFIITPLKVYDPNNESDMEYFEFGLFMSRREYKTIRRRMMSGLLDSVKDGNYVGSIPPLGYEKIKIDRKTKTLKINEQEAELVRMIFNMFVNEKITMGMVARRLTEMGIPTRTGNKEWHRATIRDILTNDIYTGKIRWNRRKVTKEFDGEIMKKVKRRREKAEYILVDGKHEPIISQEMFDEAKRIIGKQPPINADYKVTNALAGILICPKCGKKYYLNTYKSKKNARPRIIHHETQLCTSKSVLYDDVLKAICDALKDCIEDFTFKMNNDDEKAQISQREQLLHTLEQTLAKVEKKRDSLFNYLESGVYTQDEFLERKIKANQEIEELKATIEAQKNSQPVMIDYQEKIYTLHQCIDMIQNKEINPKQVNLFLKEIIDHIEMTVIDKGRQHGADVELDIFFK